MSEQEDFEQKEQEYKKYIESIKQRAQKTMDMRSDFDKQREAESEIQEILSDFYDDGEEWKPEDLPEQDIAEQAQHLEQLKADYLEYYKKWIIEPSIPKVTDADFFGKPKGKVTSDFAESQYFKHIISDFESNTSIADCVRQKMAADLPEDKDLTQKQKLGKYFGICKEQFTAKQKSEKDDFAETDSRFKTLEDFAQSVSDLREKHNELMRKKRENDVWNAIVEYEEKYQVDLDGQTTSDMYDYLTAEWNKTFNFEDDA